MSETNKGIIPSLLETQSLLALLMTVALLGVVAIATWKAQNIDDILKVIQVISTPVGIIIGFYFGSQINK